MSKCKDFMKRFILPAVLILALGSLCHADPSPTPAPASGPIPESPKPYQYVPKPADVLVYPDDQTRPGFFSMGGPFADGYLDKILETFRTIPKKPGGDRKDGFSTNVHWNREYVQASAMIYENRYSQLTDSEKEKFRSYFAERAYSVLDTDPRGKPVNLDVIDPITVDGVMAVLFPHHPDEAKFRDAFLRATRLVDLHQIRPDRLEYGALGGRYTENIGCYEPWAFGMRSMGAIGIYMRDPGGVSVPNGDLDRWLLYRMNIMSPKLTADTGDGEGTRVAPPQGAHASTRGRAYMGQGYMYSQLMERYDPRRRDAWSWFYIDNRPWTPADITNYTFKDVPPAPLWQIQDLNWRGAKPKLKSEKFWDYGVVFRRDFGTPDEMSVTVAQMQSTYYRWGQNQSGQIFYFADGKAWSWNGDEDSGDNQAEMLLGNKAITAFATMHDGQPLMIGKTHVHENLYDFDFAGQYTIVGNEGYDNWGSNGDYKKRCVTLVGKDFIVIFDQVANPDVAGDFRWFNKQEWGLPNIVQVKPGAAPVAVSNDYASKRNKTQEPRCLGVSFTGKGNFLTVVSHKSVSAESEPWGTLVNKVHKVFYSDTPVSYANAGELFEGAAGYISGNKVALFDGTKVGTGGFTFEKAARNGDDENFGLSAEVDASGRLKGLSSGHPGRLMVHMPAWKEGFKLYLNGHETAFERIADGIAFMPPDKPGSNVAWEWTDQSPALIGINFLNEEAGNGKVRLSWTDAGQGSVYEVQQSEKWGPWTSVKSDLTDRQVSLDGLKNGTPYVFRVRTSNHGTPGEWSEEIISVPVEKGPAAPDGLEALNYYLGNFLEPDAPGEPANLDIRWGQVRGAVGYTLERNEDNGAWTTVAKDLKQSHWQDQQAPAGHTYHYRVTAENLNGPGTPSISITINRQGAKAG